MIQIEHLDFIMNIDEEDGMNISFLSWKGKLLIKADEERKKEGLTYGIPVMFPTPNRTENNMFSYQEKNYKARMHGLIRNLPFLIKENSLRDDIYKVIGELHWDRTYEEFYMFPFECKIKLTIAIDHHGIYYNYEIRNLSTQSMPYGFGIHPFFSNHEGDTSIQLSTDKALYAVNMINTGQIQETKNTDMDLTEFKMVKNLQLDTVYYFEPDPREQYLEFYGFKVMEKAKIKWKKYQMSIYCSDDFSHLIVYTPNDGKQVCVEPQTCSIDGMNLLNKGFKEVSGIIELQPNEAKHGIIYIEMCQNSFVE